MTGRFRRLTFLSCCCAALALGACSATSNVDGVWDETMEARGDTFDITQAPVRVADGIRNLDRQIEEFPNKVSERFAFDEDRAIKVSTGSIEVTADTFSYLVNEWIPQVTGQATREEERAARAEEELRTQVASTRSTLAGGSGAPVSAAGGVINAAGQTTATGIDLSRATPMAPAAAGGNQFAAAPSYLNSPVLNTYINPGVAGSRSPAVTKTIQGGLEGVGRFFDQNGYTLDKMRVGSPVPPVFARRLPNNMNNSVPMNKDVFLRLMLPLSIKINEEIAAERATIERSGYSGPISGAPAAVQSIAAKYDIQSNTTNLLQRVDVLPVSLMLAQAGLESGWGTSRYVQQGNALYGQRVWDPSQPGITPSGRDADQNHRVRTFTSLEESVRSYAKNLNTNAAYLEMRRTRANFRRSGRMPSARDLIAHLSSYSEDPGYYSATINTLVLDNRLTDFDRSRLSNGQPMNLYL